MIRSMTGFGTATLEDGALSVRVEARSVNHRYLKVQLRLPRRLEALDPEIEALVQKHLRRGAVSLAVACEDPTAVVAGRIDEETVLRYRDQVVRLWNRLGRSEPAWIDPITPLLPLPGSVVTRGDDAIAGIAPELRELVLRAVQPEEAGHLVVEVGPRGGVSFVEQVACAERVVVVLARTRDSAARGLRVHEAAMDEGGAWVVRRAEGGERLRVDRDRPGPLLLLEEAIALVHEHDEVLLCE